MPSEKKKSWFDRHPILTVILILFLIGIIWGPISGSSSETSNQNESEYNYIKSMQKINLEMKEIMFRFSSTSAKVGNEEISLNQSIELYEIYRGQFQEVKTKMASLIPDQGFEKIHQHNLNAINLLIDSCDLTIQGIKQSNPSLINLASAKIKEANTEISTMTELINSKT